MYGVPQAHGRYPVDLHESNFLKSEMNPTLAGQQSNHTSVSHHGIETMFINDT